MTKRQLYFITCKNGTNHYENVKGESVVGLLMQIGLFTPVLLSILDTNFPDCAPHNRTKVD